VRFRHLRQRPAVSTTHSRGEALAVTVHGRAVEIDPKADAGFLDVLHEIYPGWDEWAGDSPYARIDAHVMFTADFRDVASG
jgi:hypothetical protein